SREEAAEDACRIIDAAIDQYLRDLRAEDAVHAIRGFRQQTERLRDEELERALRDLRRGEDPEQVVQVLARNITNKFLHHPTVQMKKAGSEGRNDILDLAQQLFVIEKEKKS